MRNLGRIENDKDIVTKEYVDALGGNLSVNDLFAMLQAGSNINIAIENGKLKITATDTNTTYGVVSTSADGLAPKRDGSTSKFLRGDGTWAVPPDTDTTYSSLKNPYALTLQGNGSTLTNGTYDGSSAKTVNITPSAISAVKSGGVTGEDGTHVMGLSWSGSSPIVGIDNNAAVKTLLTSDTCIRTAVTVSGLSSGSSYTCYYYPYLKMCFLRLYITGGTYSANTTVTVGTVNSTYKPSVIHALSVFPSQDTSSSHFANINESGQIRFRPEVAKESGDDIRIGGFWFVK